MSETHRARITFAKCVAALAILVVLAAASVTAFFQVQRKSRLKECETHLSSLIKACYNYSTGSRYVEASFHAIGSGGDWILWLQRTNEITDPKVFWCPLTNFAEPGKTNYRGYKQTCKAGTINEAPGDAVAMADRDDNHGDDIDAPMNYALKSGSVHSTPRNSEFWAATVPRYVID